MAVENPEGLTSVDTAGADAVAEGDEEEETPVHERASLASAYLRARATGLPTARLSGFTLPNMTGFTLSPATSRSLDRVLASNNATNAATLKSLQPTINAFVGRTFTLPPTLANYSFSKIFALSTPPVDFDWVNTAIQSAWEPHRKQLDETIQRISESITKSLRIDPSLLRAALLPTNLAEAEVPLGMRGFADLAMNEGLPVAFVPRSQTIEALCRAKDRAGRRAVYGRRWVSIVDDCEAALNGFSSAAVEPYVRFARRAVDGMRGGHHELAQSMSMTTLDSALLRLLPKEERKRATVTKNPLDVDSLEVWQVLVFAQVWGIHGQFWVANGDRIPRNVNRHATVHAVSPGQFTRLNATLALAHLVSMLAYLDRAYRRGHYRATRPRN